MDLRCYGLATLRNDRKLSIHLQDLDDFYYEWDVESLPWNAVTPIAPGEEHPEELDQRLVEALSEKALHGIKADQKAARGASLVFLYLYMILSKPQD